MTVRTRFSPSPTGNIHLGNARAALFGALYAAKNKGQFILRIEDTDASRSDVLFVDSLQENLRWLGIHWQEGPSMGGDYAPYFQSQRQHLYAKYYAKLEADKHIYPCFCTDQELQLARKLQLSRGLAPRYAGTCLKLSADEVKARIDSGKSPAWRFAVPQNQNIEFVDVVKGPQVFVSDEMSDFIVRRADGTAPFLFCNAIDDATMQISHVLRGEDHLANTPRQIMILQLLKLPIPAYGHLSLIVGDDGAPLSKRHGSFSVNEMRAQGFLPQAIMNYLARLGHSCDNHELLSFIQLAGFFNLDKLSRSPARFDQIQLMHWQKLAVQALSKEEAWEWWGDDVKKLVPEDKRDLFFETVRGNIELPQDIDLWARVFFQDKLNFSDETLQQLKDAGVQFFDTAIEAVNKFQLNFSEVLQHIKNQLQINGKKLFMPLRIALTGELHGPELAAIAALLGKESVLQRLEYARQLHGN